MKNKRHLDKLKRIKFKNQELRLKLIKILYYQSLKTKKTNQFKNNSINLSMINLISTLDTLGFKSKIKNRCILTGRSYSVNNKTKVSRIVFKKLIENGIFSGYFKDSW